MLRIAIALFLTPIVALFVYFFSYQLLTTWGGENVPDLSAFVFGLLPFTYVGTLVFWVPFVFFFEKKNWRGIGKYLAAGATLGAVFGAAALLFPGENTLTFEVFFIFFVSTIAGTLFAAAFWFAAIFGKHDAAAQTNRPTQ